MRTTVTLDPDVVAALRAGMRQRGVSFKEALNSAVRAGLAAPRSAQPYTVPSRPMGLRADVDIDAALRLATDLEDVELTRKLHMRK